MRYFLLAEGLGGSVLLSFINCQPVIHLKRKGHRWFFFLFDYRQRLSVWLRFFKLNFSLIFNLFTFFARFFNGLHTFWHV